MPSDLERLDALLAECVEDLAAGRGVPKGRLAALNELLKGHPVVDDAVWVWLVKRSGRLDEDDEEGGAS
jgi:hypothetical protein